MAFLLIFPGVFIYSIFSMVSLFVKYVMIVNGAGAHLASGAEAWGVKLLLNLMFFGVGFWGLKGIGSRVSMDTLRSIFISSLGYILASDLYKVCEMIYMTFDPDYIYSWTGYFSIFGYLLLRDVCVLGVVYLFFSLLNSLLKKSHSAH